LKIFLVRHGETTWNAIGQLQGKSNTHLSKKGHLQAKQIAKMLKNEKFVAIYSSPLKRAFDTAIEIVKFHDLQVIKRKELEEVNYGVFEGLTFKQIEKKHHILWDTRRKNKFKFKPKRGESFEEMDKLRIRPFVKEIKKKHKNQTIVVVAHSGPNRLISGLLLGLSPKEKVNIWQPNELFYIVEYNIKKCTIYYKKIGQKTPTKGYLNVKDMEFWNKSFK